MVIDVIYLKKTHIKIDKQHTIRVKNIFLFRRLSYSFTFNITLNNTILQDSFQSYRLTKILRFHNTFAISLFQVNPFYFFHLLLFFFFFEGLLLLAVLLTETFAILSVFFLPLLLILSLLGGVRFNDVSCLSGSESR